MSITKFQKQSVIDFAKFLDERHTALEPYTSAHDLDFKPPYSAFGGAPGASGHRAVADGRASEPVYTYVPMTVEEYEKSSGVKLDWAYYPPSLSSEQRARLATDAIVQNETARWNDFFNRGGEVSGEAWSTDTTGTDAPWAKPLRDTWYAAVDDRLEEVKVVRDEMAFLMAQLIKVAEWYPEIDLQNEVDISKYAGDETP